MLGSYAGQEGWFPASYVIQDPSRNQSYKQQQQQQPSYRQQQVRPSTPTQPESPRRPRSSPVIDYTNRPIPAIVHATPINEDDDVFPAMMGGVPGDLFEGAPKPVQYVTTNTPSSSPSFLQDQQQEAEEAPVDIYRHAPARKQRNFYNNHTNEYSPEISVQVTAKAPESPTSYPNSPQVPISPTSTAASDFWNLHPGRAPMAKTADQACELDRAFQELDVHETIRIVEEEPKKKRFPQLHIPKSVHIPKSIKNAAKKTVHAVKKH